MTPTCRECGSVALTRDGKVTCSNCGYVAGTALAEVADHFSEHGYYFARRRYLPHTRVTIALAEARDEGHAAGRAEALDDVMDHLRCVRDGAEHHICNCSCDDIRALAGKP